MNLLAILGLGFVLGLRHAIDPDHVVAVTALTTRARGFWSAAWLGIAWGTGHTLTMFAAGIAIIVFNLAIPPRVGLALELAVAIALVVVGVFNVRRPPRPVEADLRAPRVATIRAFFVGLVHGLAGSAAVALLVLATVHETRWALAYLLVFGFGTLIGMMLVTTSIAVPLRASLGRRPSLGRHAQVATGLASLVFGVWLVYQIGFVDGLFLAVPHWAPH